MLCQISSNVSLCLLITLVLCLRDFASIQQFEDYFAIDTNKVRRDLHCSPESECNGSGKCWPHRRSPCGGNHGRHDPDGRKIQHRKLVLPISPNQRHDFNPFRNGSRDLVYKTIGVRVRSIHHRRSCQVRTVPQLEATLREHEHSEVHVLLLKHRK